MNDEEILKSKQEFCNFLRYFVDIFEKNTDVVRASIEIAAFFSTLETSSWWKLSQFVRPLLEKGK